MKKGKVNIGCSGWNYKHWEGIFYPEDLKSSQWFDYYSKFFQTVEINNTFYNLPDKDVFRQWRKQAPEDFIYTVKANRYITHMKKLKNPEESLERFFSRVYELKEHLGPILYQLPPHWHFNISRLELFISLLPDDLMHVFEFRDQSWLNEKMFEVLENNGASFCLHDKQGLDIPRRATGSIAYVRFHGATGNYGGGYSESMLNEWWKWMKKEIETGRDLYVYFNNDAEGHAVKDALTLKEISAKE